MRDSIRDWWMDRPVVDQVILILLWMMILACAVLAYGAAIRWW